MKKSTTHNNESGQSTSSSFFDKKKTSDDRSSTKKDQPSFFNTPLVQTKLKFGQPNDPFEKEADAVADKVVAEQYHSKTLLTAPPAIQTKQDDDEQVQTKPAFESPGIMDLHSSRKDEMVQGKEATQTAPPSFEQNLNQSKGGGASLPKSTQSKMENSIGSDFSQVKIHTDNNAVQMNQGLGAQAFTHGNDVYFNQGKYQPGTKEGDHLLAHELTHTVQQGGVQTKMIQKVEEENPPVDPTTLSTTVGKMNAAGTEITFDNVAVPGFKRQFHRGDLYTARSLKRMKGYSDDKRPSFSTYNDNWINSISTDGLKNALRLKLGPDWTTDDAHYVFKASTGGQGSNNPYFFGSLEEIAQSLKRPPFVKNGSNFEFVSGRQLNIDHIVELQVANWNSDTWANNAENLELLKSEPNQASKTVITNSIHQKIDAFNQATDNAYTNGETSNSKRRQVIKDSYTLAFENHVDGGAPANLTEDQFWERQQIIDGEPVQGLQTAHLSELEQPGVVRIFAKNGSIPKSFGWQPGEENAVTSQEKDWISPFIVTNKFFDTSGDGELLGTVSLKLPNDFSEKTKTQELPQILVPIRRIPNSTAVGIIDKSGAVGHVKEVFDRLHFDVFSPFQTDIVDFEADGSLLLEGRIVTSIPIIDGQEIGFRISQGAVEIFKEFQLGDFAVPSPFTVSNSSVRVFYNTDTGLGVDGTLDFGINQVGEGSITAGISTGGGFMLDGAFNFDTELFDPAEIRVNYENDVFTVGGTIGIPENKIKGIRSATIDITYTEGSLSATGTADLDVPGVEQGNLNVEYAENTFTIGGDFQLNNEIPGIRGGSVGVQVTKTPEGQYKLRATGTAQPDIPGISSTVNVLYDDGIFDIEGTVGYERGLLSGEVNIGATNRAIGDDGQPTDQVTEDVKVYGGGRLTLRITPWLQATAGVQFLPNGEIEVVGRIELPDAVDVFPRKSFDRNLFSMPTIEIPIFAIPLGPRSLGIVARITGGLDLNAGIGPGQIRDLFGEIRYNPERPEETQLSGGGEFVIPADAGLTLRADLGLGLSVGIASLSGGIELAGTLGLEGEAAASVRLDWSPQSGFELNALASIMVNPKFRFDVNAFARASLDLFFLSISETWRYNLASFEWGPDIQFGAKFPIHYVEGEPFDISFDDLEFVYPELDIGSMATQLGRDIKDDIF